MAFPGGGYRDNLGPRDTRGKRDVMKASPAVTNARGSGCNGRPASLAWKHVAT